MLCNTVKIRPGTTNGYKAAAAAAAAAATPPVHSQTWSSSSSESESLASCVNTPELPETAAFIASASDAGIPLTLNYNGPEQTGAAATQSSADVSRAKRLDAFTTFVEPLFAYSHRFSDTTPKVTVCSSAMVLRVAMSTPPSPPLPPSPPAPPVGAQPVATGVELQLVGGEVVHVSAQKEVVLAAGAL